MPTNTEIIAPIVVLVAWSLVMWTWMLAIRVPYLAKAGGKMDGSIPQAELVAKLPSRIRWVGENYNHIMEQPTVFYAIVFAVYLLGIGDGINVTLAWAYVVLRIIHSLVQSLINVIPIRFLIFILSNIPLFWLTVNAWIAAM